MNYHRLVHNPVLFCDSFEISIYDERNWYQLIQDLFISQSDRTDLQAQIGTDSQEYDITEDDLH